MRFACNVLSTVVWHMIITFKISHYDQLNTFKLKLSTSGIPTSHKPISDQSLNLTWALLQVGSIDKPLPLPFPLFIQHHASQTFPSQPDQGGP